MNIIVTNQYKDLIEGTNIEIMKELNGVFKVSEIANSFNSIFYKKLIIDATALERFPKEDVLKDLAKAFDTEKLILFLPPDNSPPKKFLSFLVSLNIYNFTDNIKGLVELVNKSNTFEDVKDFVITNQVSKNRDLGLDFSQDIVQIENGRIILGIKNVTKNSGSTSLVYMLKKTLEEVHKKDVIAVEIDKRDFIFYNAKNMYSIGKNKLGEFFSLVSPNQIVLVDLDDSNDTDICTDIIYLVEPSLYKINQLVMNDRTAFNKLKGKKVVLNNNLLDSKDINIFAREAGISIYFTLPPLNDRIFNPILNQLLSKLGLIGESDEKPKKGLFDFFK